MEPSLWLVPGRFLRLVLYNNERLLAVLSFRRALCFLRTPHDGFPPNSSAVRGLSPLPRLLIDDATNTSSSSSAWRGGLRLFTARRVVRPPTAGRYVVVRLRFTDSSLLCVFR